MRNLIYTLIALFTGVVHSQIKLTGAVQDSIGNPLELANIIAYDISNNKMATYGFTDANGNYMLSFDNMTDYNIKVTYLGYKNIEEIVSINKTNVVKNFTMFDDNTLDEVTIVAKLPITVKGDTIVYNADSFKNGSERKLEDVLKKLPGIEIDEDGGVKFQGTSIEKVMIDGKAFFDGDTKLASRNIPSDVVDKIQVLQNYGDVNQLKGVQNNQNRVALNLKLKEGKENFWFGNLTLGGGLGKDEALYLFQPKLFYYSSKFTLNYIGDLNNIGEVGLSRNDLRNFNGGFRSQSNSSGTNFNLGDNGMGFLNTSPRNTDSFNTKSSAVNFSYVMNSKLDIDGFLIWSGNTNSQGTNTSIDYIDSTIPDDFTSRRTNQTSNTGLFKLGATYKKNSSNQLNYDIMGRFSNELRTENINSLILGNLNEGENATPFKINQNLSYFYTLNEKNIFALEVNHLLQDEDPIYNIVLENNSNNSNSIVNNVANTLGLNNSVINFNLNQNRRIKTNQADLKLDYYHILNTKSNLNFVAGSLVSRQNFDSKLFQTLNSGEPFSPSLQNLNIDDPIATNYTAYNFLDLYAGLRYRVKSGIFTFTPGFTVHSYKYNNEQFNTEFTEDTFQRILPEVSILAQFRKNENLSLEYRQEINFTDVNQIARGIVLNSYNSLFYGNPDLTNEVAHNAKLSYANYSQFNGTNFYASANYTKTIDKIVTDFNFIPQSVVSSRTSTNSELDTENIGVNVGFGKSFKRIRASINGTFNYSKIFNILNGELNENNIYSQIYSARLSTNFRKAPNVSLNYGLSIQEQKNPARTDNIKGFLNIPSISFDAYLWDALTLKSDFSINRVEQSGMNTESFNLWNFSISYRKDSNAKWEYELVGTNLLDTSVRANTSANDIQFSVTETFILPRYISLRIKYQL